MSGDNCNVNGNSNMGAQPPNEMQWLTNYFTSLYRKDVMEKPTQFQRHSNIDEHIKKVEKYFENIKVVDDLGKVCILFDTLQNSIKDELIFESDYESNATNYSWHKNILKRLFPIKENVTTNLTELFDLKQGEQTFSEFACKIKSEVVRRMRNNTSESRQKIALEIFLSGLNDEKLIKALRAQNPTDLNEVLSLVKSINVVNVNTSSNIAGVHKYDEKNSEINELKKQVTHLTQLVFSLRKSISEILGKNNNFPQNTYPNITNNRQYKFCSFCNMKNHTDLECFRKRKTNISNEIQCYNCNKRGHISRACPNRKRFNVIHRDSDRMEAYETDNASVSISQQSQYDLPVTCAISISKAEEKKRFMENKIVAQRKVTRPAISQKKPIKYSADVEKDYEYILGQRTENSYGRTYANVLQNAMTINNRSENVLKNRPVIRGRLNSINTNMFLDTGSEINVINQTFLDKLFNGEYILNKSQLNVNCANGSKMNVVGSIDLNVQVGPTIKLLNFIVATSVFPSTIIGLHGMKSLKLNINLNESSVISRGVIVPFNTKISSESELKAKNVKFLQKSAGLQENINM